MLIDERIGRRAFMHVLGMHALGAGGLAAAFRGAFGDFGAGAAQPVMEVAQAGNAPMPKESLRFAVCGMSHDHIYGMTEAIRRGGGQLVLAYGVEPDKVASYRKRYPDVKWASSEDEILNDNSIQLVLSSKIANERAALGVRAMKSGKDFLSDKPGITTLEDLSAVRKTIAETKRIYAIMYSERLEVPAAVKAGELVKAGAIGKVIQTINIAPHQVTQRTGDAGGGSGRPEWFWHPRQYGGILCDIGSHQVDQFLYYTGSTTADVVEAQVANVRHHDHPEFQDFGDMTLRGNRGFGYVRLDWFTPGGLATWGDGRLFILGTDGYIEVRKYANVAVEGGHGNNLYIVDQKQARYMDCRQVELPFGPQFVSDVVNRTHTAQDQEQCLLAAELSIAAQMSAKQVTIQD
jgi:predicted dehydrogenase